MDDDDLIIKFSEQIRQTLSTAPPESIALLNGVLVPQMSTRELVLACALVASEHPLLSWIPHSLSSSAAATFRLLSQQPCTCSLVEELIPQLKDAIQQSSLHNSEEDISARTPVAHAVVAAHQFRWLVSQIDSPQLVKLCNLVIPCALTAIDHWSPSVKGQAMITFIHIGKNIDITALACFQDAILDACCLNIASSDEIWHLVIQMSVLFATCFHQTNPRCAWYERMLNEMLNHLERQPRNKDRRVAWLQHIEPFFNSLGLLLLAHSNRIFPLFFQWMHTDDDETVLLVLNQVLIVIRLTWIRNTPHIERLVDELATLYKSPKKFHVDIKRLVAEILVLLHECKGMQFEAAYDKHRWDPN